MFRASDSEKKITKQWVFLQRSRCYADTWLKMRVTPRTVQEGRLVKKRLRVKMIRRDPNKSNSTAM